jgi:hypothetical protein
MECIRRIPASGKPCKHYIKSAQPHEPGLCALPREFLCTEAMKKFFPRLSHSSKNEWIRCRYSYFLSHIENWEPMPSQMSDPVKMGAIWDKWLAECYRQEKYVGSSYLKELCKEYRVIEEDTVYSKLHALCKAFVNIGMKLDTSQMLGTQFEINLLALDLNVIGYVDRAYHHYFVESKLSARPDYYEKIHHITSQIGTYFLAMDGWEWVDMEIARTPELKQKDSEEPEAYSERIFQDIIRRPSFYFIGYNSASRTFGRRYYRSEFPLDEIRRTYKIVMEEMLRAKENINEVIYKNYASCYSPGPCNFLPVCMTGVISDSMFRKKQKKEQDKKGE